MLLETGSHSSQLLSQRRPLWAWGHPQLRNCSCCKPCLGCYCLPYTGCPCRSCWGWWRGGGRDVCPGSSPERSSRSSSSWCCTCPRPCRSRWWGSWQSSAAPAAGTTFWHAARHTAYSSGHQAAEPPGLGSSTRQRPLRGDKRKGLLTGVSSGPAFSQWHQGTLRICFDKCKANFYPSSEGLRPGLIRHQQPGTPLTVHHALFQLLSCLPRVRPEGLTVTSRLLSTPQTFSPSALRTTLGGCCGHHLCFADEKTKAWCQECMWKGLHPMLHCSLTQMF